MENIEEALKRQEQEYQNTYAKAKSLDRAQKRIFENSCIRGM